jgi:hypothetical protein
MKQALIYSLKVWLTSVTLAPIILSLLLPNPEGTSIDLPVLFLTIFIGAFMSFPSATLFYVASRAVNENKILTSKLLLTLLATFLTYLPIWIHSDFKIRYDKVTLVILSSYCAVIIAGIWFYKLKPVSQGPNIEPAA